MLCPNFRFTGKESGRVYRLIRPLEPAEDKGISHVWLAVDDADESRQFVVKGPKPHDHRSLGYPLFQHEYKMQVQFRNSKMIRRMVDHDFDLPTAAGTEPKMVLEPYAKDLWTVRKQRPMTANEIKWITSGILLGLWDIHREGLVHSGDVSVYCSGVRSANLAADLKMENVGISGFDPERPVKDVRNIIVQLADCGSSKSNRLRTLKRLHLLDSNMSQSQNQLMERSRLLHTGVQRCTFASHGQSALISGPGA